MEKLSVYIEGRDNNFNLIRFLAASLVIFSHSFPLALGRGHIDPLQELTGMSLGTLAVDVFFLTSGFLIAASLFRSESPLRFLWNRILRLYPALIIAIIFCVFVVGLFFTELSGHEYLSSSGTYKFWWKNSTLIFGGEAYLPGVFLDLPHEKAVNGSLWTLPWEVRMYGILFVLGCVHSYTNMLDEKWLKLSIVLIGLLSMGIYICNKIFPFITNQTLVGGIRLQSLFFIGGAAFVLRDKISLSGTLALILLVGLVALLVLHPSSFYIPYFISLPFLVLVFAYLPAGRIRLFNNFGDYSYGIYVYAFPVQQMCMACFPDLGVYMLTLLAFPITLVLSVMSWHLVEKPMLAKKNIKFPSSISRMSRAN